MSFNPAVSDFSNPLTPEKAFPPQIGVTPNHLTHPRTPTVKQTNNLAAAKVSKTRMPRARKARARLRKQNRLRAQLARIN